MGGDLRMFVAPGWLLGATGNGAVLVGPEREFDISAELPIEDLVRLVRAFGEGADPKAVAGTDGPVAGAVDDLLGLLIGAGALVDRPGAGPDAEGMPLAEALVAAAVGRRVARLVWTADELLVVGGVSARAVRRALRAFVGGMESHRQMAAYCLTATLADLTVVGDQPLPGAATVGLEVARQLPDRQVHVVSLWGGDVVSAPPEGPGVRRPHRLGPAVTCGEVARRETGAPDLSLFLSRVAHPNLRHPGRGHGYAIGMAEQASAAELAARGEAAERYAVSDPSPQRLVRARADELDGAVPPDALFAYNRRQLAGTRAEEGYNHDGSYLWIRSVEGRWLPASLVFNPFQDPDAPGLPSAGNSGAAAHTSFDEAAERAFAELIERDALTWTWVQRVARERVDPSTYTDRIARWARALESGGWSLALVNLTLETKPVILCMMSRGKQVAVGSACREDPVSAAEKALIEACTTQWGRAPAVVSVPMQDVRTPLDHLRFHYGSDGAHARDFLASSPDSVPLESIRGVEGTSRRAVDRLGEPLVVDISSEAVRPFTVVRAFVPGMVPLAFGYDAEPLGLHRLGEPRTTVDGMRVGGHVDLDALGPILPHPFP